MRDASRTLRQGKAGLEVGLEMGRASPLVLALPWRGRIASSRMGEMTEERFGLRSNGPR